jgi:branched-chain amino acid transport system substrate-binding protein
MSRTARNRRSRMFAVGAFAVAVTAVLSACGSSSRSTGSTSGGSKAGLPSVIKIESVTDLTGAAAYSGTSQVKGAQVAIDEINSMQFLGNSKLQLVSKDTGQNAQTAASLASQAVSDKSISAMLGTINGVESVAVAPITQAGKLPIAFTQSNSPGVLIGNYEYRVTTPYGILLPKVLQYIQTKGVRKVAIIYLAASPTYQNVVNNVFPTLGKQYGFTVISATGITATTTDFSAPVQKALSGNPDLVVELTVGADSPVVTQLRQAGYNGIVLTQPGAAANLKAAGAAAHDVMWPTDFSYLSTDPNAVKFTKAYGAKYSGALPLNYAAEGYDAIWLIARGIKTANSSNRVAIQQGMDTVAQAGFSGAEGKLAFDNRDLRVDTIIGSWDPAKQVQTVITP